MALAIEGFLRAALPYAVIALFLYFVVMLVGDLVGPYLTIAVLWIIALVVFFVGLSAMAAVPIIGMLILLGDVFYGIWAWKRSKEQFWEARMRFREHGEAWKDIGKKIGKRWDNFTARFRRRTAEEE